MEDFVALKKENIRHPMVFFVYYNIQLTVDTERFEILA